VLVVEVPHRLVGDGGLGGDLGLDVLLERELLAGPVAEVVLGDARLRESLLVTVFAGEVALLGRDRLLHLVVGDGDPLGPGVLLEEVDGDQLLEHLAVEVGGRVEPPARLGHARLHHLGAVHQLPLLDLLAVHPCDDRRDLVGLQSRCRSGRSRLGRAGGGSGQVEGSRLLAGLPRGRRRSRSRRGGLGGLLAGGGLARRDVGDHALVAPLAAGPEGEEQGEPQERQERNRLGHIEYLEADG
jgi:hypothetical protein